MNVIGFKKVTTIINMIANRLWVLLGINWSHIQTPLLQVGAVHCYELWVSVSLFVLEGPNLMGFALVF